MQREGRAGEQLGAGVRECASGPGSAAADPPPAGSRPGVLHSVTRAARRPAALQPRAPAPATAAGPERAPAPPLRSLRYLEPERAREREKVKGRREGERKERENMGASSTNCRQIVSKFVRACSGSCVLNGRERMVMVAVVCVRV